MPGKSKKEMELIIERCDMKQSAHLHPGSGNGIVNVYAFTCIPGNTTSVMVKSLVSELGVPYLNAPNNSSVQPGRESAIEPFAYQVHQHYKRRRRRGMTEGFAQ